MAESIGTGYIRVLYDVSGLSAASSGVMGKIGPLFQKYGKLAGASLGVGVAVGIGVELAHIGDELEEAHHRLQQQTGATGKELEGLWDETKDIATRVPASFDDVADAVGRVRQRLQIGRKAGAEFTETMLDLSKVTGTDVKSGVDAVGKILNRWEIPASQATKVADELYRGSARTGVGFTDLAKNVTAGTGVLQKLGLTFEQGVAVMGKIEQKGYSFTKMQMGLNSAVADIATAGKDPSVVLPKLFETIRKAKDPVKALALGVETFGKRAGGQLVGAIRAGVFSVDELAKHIGKGRETIKGTAEETRSFDDNMKIIKNTMKTAVAPAAEAVAEALKLLSGWIAKRLPGAIDDLSKQIHEAWPTMGKDVAGASADIQESIKQVAHIVDRVWHSAFGEAFRKVVLLNVTAVAHYIRNMLRVIRDVLQLVSDVLDGKWGAAWRDAKKLLRDVLAGMLDNLRHVPIVSVLLSLASKAFNAAKRLAGRIKDGIVAGLRGIAGAVGGAAAAAVNAMVDVINKFGIHIHKTILGHGIDVDWSPNLDHVAFAKGGVVSAPTLALIGETRRSRPEIVTPDALLRKIVRQESGGGVAALTITNWEEGTGYFTRLADSSVAGHSRHGRQRARMTR